MAKGENSIGAAGKPDLRLLGNAADRLGHTPDSAQNPHFIAYPDLPVGTSVAHEFALRGCCAGCGPPGSL